MESLTPIEQSRIEKLRILEKAGIVCFPERFERDDIAKIRNSVDCLLPTPVSQLDTTDRIQRQAIAGRIT